MVGHRALLGLLVVGSLTSACAFREPLTVEAQAGGRPFALLYEDDLREVGVYDSDGGFSPCFVYRDDAGEVGGSRCMATLQPDGWAVEVSALRGADPTDALLLVAGHERAAVVRLPQVGGGHREVRLRRVAGIRHPVAVVPLDLTRFAVDDNRVTAYAADGVYLGRTHECDGDVDGCGPFDGLVDRGRGPGSSSAGAAAVP